MNRRDFLLTAGLLAGAAGTFSLNAFGNTDVYEVSQPKPEGPVTLYYEFRIAGPELEAMKNDINSLAALMGGKAGFLGLSLKLTTGRSTAVDNFLESYKGMLLNAYADAAKQGRAPFLYALLVRFENYDALVASGAKQWFIDMIEPRLFAYSKDANGLPFKTPIALKYYQGIYRTTFCADRINLYTTAPDMVKFLRNQQDDVSAYPEHRAVKNHIMLDDSRLAAFLIVQEAAINQNRYLYRPLDTDPDYDPVADPDKIGIPGTMAVGDYKFRQAITREILISAYAEGGIRKLLMHGLWETAADHENSHQDPRFKAEAAQIGVFVLMAPVEPFYKTEILVNQPA